MKKQAKQTNEKKFNVEKMEVVKLTSMRKVIGGQGGNVTTIDDPKTITDSVQQNNSKNC